MIKELHIPLFNMVTCLSNAMDLVSRELTNHHKRVAFIAWSLANELHLPMEEREAVVVGAAMHDAGALSLGERLRTLHFDIENPHQHADAGYQLLKDFQPFSEAARVVRYHHVPWDNGAGSEFRGEQVPFGSHILQLADRVDILVDRNKEVLGQVGNVLSKRVSFWQHFCTRTRRSVRGPRHQGTLLARCPLPRDQFDSQ